MKNENEMEIMKAWRKHVIVMVMTKWRNDEMAIVMMK